MSFSRWNYVNGNPINFTDPTGNKPLPPKDPDDSMGPWCSPSSGARARFAEKYVENVDMDELNTYTAAGIGVQCFGTNYKDPWHPKDWANSGEGIAQISDNQASTEYGEEVGNNRGFGLLCWIKKNAGVDSSCDCLSRKEMKSKYGDDFEKNYELEKAHNQNVPKWAVIYMRRRIEMVVNKCEGCNDVDKFIIAALAQNGPGFTIETLKDVISATSKGSNGLNWEYWYDNKVTKKQSKDEYPKQLRIFHGVATELKRDGYYFPLSPFDLSDQKILTLMSK